MNKFKHLDNVDYAALQYQYFVCMVKIVIADKHFLLCKYN